MLGPEPKPENIGYGVPIPNAVLVGIKVIVGELKPEMASVIRSPRRCVDHATDLMMAGATGKDDVEGSSSAYLYRGSKLWRFDLPSGCWAANMALVTAMAEHHRASLAMVLAAYLAVPANLVAAAKIKFGDDPKRIAEAIAGYPTTPVVAIFAESRRGVVAMNLVTVHRGDDGKLVRFEIKRLSPKEAKESRPGFLFPIPLIKEKGDGRRTPR